MTVLSAIRDRFTSSSASSSAFEPLEGDGGGGGLPFAGYDALSIEEIATALKEADLATVKKVRGYERKFARRPEVVEEAVRLLHLRQATEPVSAVPAYQSASGASAAISSGDRAEKGGRP